MNPVPPIRYEVVQEALRSDLPMVALAAIVLVVGLSALLLWRLRTQDPLLLWLGILSSLYGLRLLLANDLIRVAAGLPRIGQYRSVDVITYCIGIPFVGFFRELLGSRWRKGLTILLGVEIAFAPLAIGWGVIAGHYASAMFANSLLVVAGTVVGLIASAWLFGRVPGAMVLKYVVGLFLLTVILTNLRLTGGREIEPLGFLALLFGLTYTAARRTVDREQKLIAVEKELETARRIQNAILPKHVPDLDGLRIAARYEPMTAVAGDFYDFLEVDNQRVTILVADVSGHGVPAALIASMLKVAFAGQASHARNPAEILAGLNRALGGLVPGQFVTAACAFIDLEEGTVTYAGAGHPPTLLLRNGSKEVVELAENGLFLGPFAHARYSNVSTSFTAGDYLLLYTDGIIEATMSDTQPFGGDRLKEFALRSRGANPSTLADDLIQKVSGNLQEDDLTVVAAYAC
ncbi:MAG TPA: PP2C family protein-serine/threonine phosphatase [Bryobacteraceae bacterium]|nr:PP2C family protein-serine/threonine phosphatase [Bryobacteraceae bacterium]